MVDTADRQEITRSRDGGFNVLLAIDKQISEDAGVLTKVQVSHLQNSAYIARNGVNLGLCNKPNICIALVFQNDCNIGFEKHQKWILKHWIIDTDIDYNISSKWYHWGLVIGGGNFDFVSYKYTKSAQSYPISTPKAQIFAKIDNFKHINIVSKAIQTDLVEHCHRKGPGMRC